MSTIHTDLEFKRFIKQVSTGPSAVVVTASMAEQNFRDLQDQDWRAVSATESAMPPLNFTTNPLINSYDAFKYASDYAEGKQKAYAGAVAYRVTLPADAVAGTVANITNVDVNLYVDRWLIGGVRVSALISDDAMPPNSWTDVLTGDAYSATQLPATDPRADQNTTVSIAVASEASKAYLYIMVTLEDYESASPLDSRRLEGGALIIGQSIETTFDRSVTAAVPDNFVFEVDYVGDTFSDPIRLNIFSNKYYNGNPAAVMRIDNIPLFPAQSKAYLVEGSIPDGDIWIFAFVDLDDDGVFKKGGICGVPHNAPDAIDRTAAIPLNLFAESYQFGIGVVTQAVAPDPTYYEWIADSATRFPTIHWNDIPENTNYFNQGSTGIQIKDMEATVLWTRDPAGGTGSLEYDPDKPGVYMRNYIHIGDWLSSRADIGNYFSPMYGWPTVSFAVSGLGSPVSNLSALIFSFDTTVLNYAPPETPVIEEVAELYSARPVVSFSTPDRHCGVVFVEILEETVPGNDIWTVVIESVSRVMPPPREDGVYRCRISTDLPDGDYKATIQTVSNREVGKESTLAELEFTVSLA